MGSVMLLPRKESFPFYNQPNLRLLQGEPDRLEILDVLAKPEDLGVAVRYASSNVLVRKPQGRYHFVNALNKLSHTRLLVLTATS